MTTLWAPREGQLPPAGDWKIWVITGRRGTGKTRAAAEFVKAEAEAGSFQRGLFLAASSLHIRDNMLAPLQIAHIAYGDFIELEWRVGLDTGPRVLCRSVESELRGLEPEFLWWDEPGLSPLKEQDNAWTMLSHGGLRLPKRTVVSVWSGLLGIARWLAERPDAIVTRLLS